MKSFAEGDYFGFAQQILYGGVSRPVPTYVESDIDNEGRGVGPELGCLECHETKTSRWSLGSQWMTRSLCCGECGEPFFEEAI